jgi:hypothetical protein
MDAMRQCDTAKEGSGTMRKLPANHAARIALLYAALSALWIYLPGRTLDLLFAAVTAALLYWQLDSARGLYQ